MKTTPVLDEKSGILHFGRARMILLDIEAGFWSIRRQLDAMIGVQLTNSVLQQAGVNGGTAFVKTFGTANSVSDQQDVFDSCLQAYQTAGFGKFEISSMDWPIAHVTIRAKDTFEAWTVRQKGQQVDNPICAYTAGVLVGFINAIKDRNDVICIELSCQAKGDESCTFELMPSSQANHKTAVAYLPDPGLGRQLNLLEILFNRMPMGIAVFDRSYHFRRYNPTWVDFSNLYAPPTAAPLVPGVYYFDHLPGSESMVIPLFERVLAGETIRQPALRFESGGIVSYWDVVLAPLIENGEVNGILNVTIDATERVMAQQNLEQRVEERTGQLRTLLQVSQDITSTLELTPLLDLILEQLRIVVDYNGASILIMENGVLVLGAHRGPIPKKDAQNLQFPLDGTLVNLQVIEQPEPLIIPDVMDDTPLALKFRQTAGGKLKSHFGHVRSWLGVPLRYKGEILGVLTLDHSTPNFFTAQHAELIQVFANQVAIAIENASLYAQAEDSAAEAERSRLARDLHDAVTQTLFSASLIAEVLPKVWEQDTAVGKQKLEELRLLTRGALSEMRTLLLELRPATLVEMNLGDLLRHLATAFTGRTRIPVDLNTDGQIDLDPEVKLVFYRVAQEAFNNIHKHAEATRVLVNLQGSDQQVQMEILDNGRGFDLISVLPNQMGLGIMQERTETIGAKLKIQSAKGTGTSIKLIWKDEIT